MLDEDMKKFSNSRWITGPIPLHMQMRSSRVRFIR
jgi:hypothetical protein